MTSHLNFKFRIQTSTVLISIKDSLYIISTSEGLFSLLSLKTQQYSVKNQLPSEEEENLWRIFGKSRKELFPASVSACRVPQKFYTVAKGLKTV